MTAKRIAFYVQDTGDPKDTADDQMERLLAQTAGEDTQVVREYTDYRNLNLHRMLGEGTQEEPPFDEVVVTDVSLLGDTKEEAQQRLAELGELGEKGVQVRVLDGNETPST